MSLFSLSFLDDSSTEVEFDPSSDAADTELASDAMETVEAVSEVASGADGVDEVVEASETFESLISFGKIAAKGQPVNMGGLYMAESHLARLPEALYKDSLQKLDQPDFESAVSDESAMRQRALQYCSESFLSDAKAVIKRGIAWLVAQFEKAIVIIKKLFTSAAKIKKSLEDIKSELSKDADYLASSEKEISVNAGWLNDGKKVNPLKAVGEAKSVYTTYAGKVKQLTGGLKGKFSEIKAKESDYANIIRGIETQRSATFGTSAVISGHKLGIVNGRVVVGGAPSIEKKVIPALSKSELVAFIGEAIGLASELEKHKDHIKEAETAKNDEIKLINDAAKELDKASSEEGDSEKTAELRRKITALTKVSCQKDLASLNAVSGAAFGVSFAAHNLAKSNQAALAKKKSS